MPPFFSPKRESRFQRLFTRRFVSLGAVPQAYSALGAKPIKMSLPAFTSQARLPASRRLHVSLQFLR